MERKNKALWGVNLLGLAIFLLLPMGISAAVTVPFAMPRAVHLGLWHLVLIPLAIAVIALLAAIASFLFGWAANIDPWAIVIGMMITKDKSAEEIIDLYIQREESQKKIVFQRR